MPAIPVNLKNILVSLNSSLVSLNSTPVSLQLDKVTFMYSLFIGVRNFCLGISCVG